MSSAVTKKQMEEDEIQEAGRHFAHYLAENRHLILIVLLSVLLVVVGVWFVRSRSARVNQQANALLFEAKKHYDEALDSTDPLKRKELAGAAIEVLDALRKKEAGSIAARHALYLRGASLALQQDFNGAIQAYEAFAKEAGTPEAAVMARLAVGYALENQSFLEKQDKGLLEKAAVAYEAARKADSPDGKNPGYLTYEALLALARVKAQLGDLAAARSLCEQVKKERPFSKEGTPNLSEKDWSDFQSLDRAGKSRLIRLSLLDNKARYSYEKRAEQQLEELDARAGTAPAEAK